MKKVKVNAWVGTLLSLCVLSSPVMGEDLDFSPTTSFKDSQKSIGSGAARAIDVVLSEAGLRAAIQSVGLTGNSASKVEQVVGLALKNLTGVENPDRTQLARGLRGISSGADGRLKRRLTTLLSESERELSKEEFVELVNSLVYLAGRYGVDNSLAMACSACISGPLAKKGFRFTYDEIADEKTAYILNSVVPRSPNEVVKYIKKNLKSQKLTTQKLNYLSELPKEDEKVFALFLAIPTHGSPAQKELYEAIKLISKKPSKNGNVNVLDPKNPHQLWRLFGSDLNEVELEGWSRMLRSVAEDAKKKKEVSKKAAFYRHLEAKASGNAALDDRLELIKTKNCFFK